MPTSLIRKFVFATALSLAPACGTNTADVSGVAEPDFSTEEAELASPGSLATDARVPELGSDLNVLNRSKLSMAEGLVKAEQNGPVIEAKFEIDHDGKLALSLYPLGKAFSVDAERNVFQELAGDAAIAPFKGSLSVFDDREHLLRSARDLTLMQLSTRSLASVVDQASVEGTVFWAIPTIRNARAGYGVYTWDGKKKRYHFYDGRGSRELTWWPTDLGTGPGSKATDTRTPKLGTDLSVVKQSKISLRAAVARVEAKYGPVIEAKFELGDDGKLSLSVYPVGKGLEIDAERNTFFEVEGDPTISPWTMRIKEFDVPDAEHLTRSSRDLTIVQTASLSLSDAVEMVEDALPGGTVFWAIPTVRGTRSGFGIYALGCDGKQHYFFVS
jgi:hypothetical protein